MKQAAYLEDTGELGQYRSIEDLKRAIHDGDVKTVAALTRRVGHAGRLAALHVAAWAPAGQFSLPIIAPTTDVNSVLSSTVTNIGGKHLEVNKTALSVAISEGPYEAVRCLLALGADPNPRGENDLSPLCSIRNRGENEHDVRQCVRALTEAGARIDDGPSFTTGGMTVTMTPLFYVANQGAHAVYIRELLRAGADIGRIGPDVFLDTFIASLGSTDAAKALAAARQWPGSKRCTWITACLQLGRENL